jgi:hypothetical protein
MLNGKGKAKNQGWLFEALRVPLGVREHKDLKPLTPAQGSIWRDNVNLRSQAHFLPFARVSYRFFHLGPRRGAAIRCLRYFWAEME